ncbi:hypothetical protein L209DRAFT_192215 [Thermothelomyces heterothallicus CBS 203.75]
MLLSENNTITRFIGEQEESAQPTPATLEAKKLISNYIFIYLSLYLSLSLSRIRIKNSY